MKPKFDFLTISDLFDMPEPEWLIEGVIKKGSFAQLYGVPGSWKTFVALNWALSVAAGVEWMPGRKTQQGNVVYIVGEGIDDFGKRIKAWLAFRQVSLESIQNHIRFVPESVQLLDEEQVDAFLAGLAAELDAPPTLVVVDTLSRAMVGVDEDKAQYMTQAIHAAERIKEATGAAVLPLHHSPYSANRGRGSSTLPGALDAIVGMRNIKKKTMQAELHCDKQKNSSEFAPIKIKMLAVGDSLVASCEEKSTEPGDPNEASPSARALLAVLDAAGPVGLSWSKWRESSQMPESSFSKALSECEASNLIQKAGKIYVSRRFTLTLRKLHTHST